MDKYKIDSHKLMYHVSRVNQWLNGEDVYPVYVEIGLNGGCNHKCVFCAFDYLDKNTDILDENIAKKLLVELSKKGIKSVLYSGEGEPLLHDKANEIIAFTKQNKIDAALSTNGVLLDEAAANDLLPNLTWIRVSLNAGTKEVYSEIHGTVPWDLEKVMKNLEYAVKLKKDKNYACTIGVQFLLLQNNIKELVPLVKILKNIGVDYLAIKPYSQHPLSDNKMENDISSAEMAILENDLKQYSENRFDVILRAHAINNIKEEKTYDRCYGLSFITHVAASGNIYPCNTFVGNEQYAYGNIYQEGFEEIWAGEKRKNVVNKISKEFGLKVCRKSCRMDEINRYLWELKNPDSHTNFI